MDAGRDVITALVAQLDGQLEVVRGEKTLFRLTFDQAHHASPSPTGCA